MCIFYNYMYMAAILLSRLGLGFSKIKTLHILSQHLYVVDKCRNESDSFSHDFFCLFFLLKHFSRFAEHFPAIVV